MKIFDKLLKIGGNPFILASLSIGAYVISYQYQLGYLSFFGIPTYFVSLDLPSIITSLLVSVTVVFTMNMLSQVENIRLPIKDQSIFLRDLLWTVLSIQLVFLILRLFQSGFDWRKVFLVVILLILFIVGFIYYPKIHSNISGLEVPGEASILKNYLGVSYWSFFVYCYIFYIFVNIFYQIGYLKASSLTKFDTANFSGQNFVVVARNGDNLLILPFNPEDKTIKRELHLQSLESLRFGNGVLNLTQTPDLHLSGD